MEQVVTQNSIIVGSSRRRAPLAARLPTSKVRPLSKTIGGVKTFALHSSAGALYLVLASLVVVQLLEDSSPLKNMARASYALARSAVTATPVLWVRGPSQKRREVTQQIKYVSQLIESHGMEESDARELARTILIESRVAAMDPLLVTAVIKRESTFKAHAVSHRGALGLMQVMPATGRYLLKELEEENGLKADLKEPSLNLRLGIIYLKKLTAMYGGNLEHALIAYNWGPGNLSLALKYQRAIPQSSIQYARRILLDRKQYHSAFGQQVAQAGKPDSFQTFG